MYLPPLFLEKMRNLLVDDFDKYIASFQEPRYYGLRVNTTKISVAEFLKIAPWPLVPIPWIENGFYYDGETIQAAKHPYYHAGLYYLQEPSAMTPANRLPIEAGDRVLDLCAAPGGKATELGAKLDGQGLLVANDISSSRAKALLKNLELSGIGNSIVVNEEGERLADFFPDFFDKILIDAPCSGEGMFRKEPKMIKAWEEHGPTYFAKIQKRLILQGAKMLKAGGLLLYSTCTFDGRENEEIIDYLLKSCPDMQLIEMEDYESFTYGVDLKHARRLYPHKLRGEGHFLALLKKTSSQKNQFDQVFASRENLKRVAKDKGSKCPNMLERNPELQDFLKSIKRAFDPSRLTVRGERVFYLPENMQEKAGLRLLRTGLYLGELKRKRFEPSQALAMNLKADEYAHTLDFPLDDERVVRYLKGETIDLSDMITGEDAGWYLLCVDGFPLGFGKLGCHQILKNKYLPGWRWL